MATILVLTGDLDPSRKNPWSESVTSWLASAGHKVHQGTTKDGLIFAMETSTMIIVGDDDPNICELIPSQFRHKTLVITPIQEFDQLHFDRFQQLDAVGFSEIVQQLPTQDQGIPNDLSQGEE